MNALRATVGLGGNLGDVLSTFRAALDLLHGGGVTVQRVASAYRNAAMHPPGYAGPPSPDYWNSACLLHTTLAPRALLDRLHAIERELGRERGERWADRVLDLDLLTYAEVSLDEPGLTLPHPGLWTRAFVLAPLAEIAPDLALPDGRTVTQVRAALVDPEAGLRERRTDWRRVA